MLQCDSECVTSNSFGYVPGFGSQAVINGDLTQIDLPKHITSGLDHVIHVLKDTSGIGITRFSSNDVIRHPLVRKIIDAYKKFEQNINK